MHNAKDAFPTLAYLPSALEAGQDADVVLRMTEWEEFRALRPADLAPIVRERNMLDGRNVLDPDQWRAAGWQFRALGRSQWAGRPAAQQLDLGYEIGHRLQGRDAAFPGNLCFTRNSRYSKPRADRPRRAAGSFREDPANRVGTGGAVPYRASTNRRRACTSRAVGGAPLVIEQASMTGVPTQRKTRTFAKAAGAY
jgi:hypothetical protein